MTTPPKPPADASKKLVEAKCAKCGNQFSEYEGYPFSWCEPCMDAAQPLADALPEVKALCAKLGHIRIAFVNRANLQSNPSIEKLNVADAQTCTEAITALERLSGTNDLLTRCWEEALPNIEKLKTELRSSEAALAEARRLHGELRGWCNSELGAFESVMAELTALRANAGRDSAMLDWLEVNKGRCGYSEQTYIGEGYFAHEYTQGDKYEAAPTLRDAIRAAIDAASRPETKGDNE